MPPVQLARKPESAVANFTHMNSQASYLSRGVSFSLRFTTSSIATTTTTASLTSAPSASSAASSDNPAGAALNSSTGNEPPTVLPKWPNIIPAGIKRQDNSGHECQSSQPHSQEKALFHSQGRVSDVIQEVADV
ncbi:UNVERIFIED_CONTAM: hypothetical protein HHA_462170 [Hammondia hammondi]|eukprot:XP_008884380.1 hypothetical protein HHA_462170 [Hammondia hammondi]